MAYMQKVLSLIQSAETVQFIKPWWEVVEQFTIDAMMLVAVTSVTADLFQGKGALQCVARNKTLTFNAQQMFFVNQECTESWPIYAKYFPYFLFFQCVLFVIVNNVWFGLCKDTIVDFSKLVERCNKTPIRRKDVRKLMKYLDERKAGRVLRKELGASDASDHNDEFVIEALSLKERLSADEAEVAMSLCEEVSDVTELLEKSIHSSVAYYAKCLVSICLVIGVFALGVTHLHGGDFDFFFACFLDRQQHADILDEEYYVCVNKTTTLSKWLQILFLVEVTVFALADFYGMIGWCRVMLATGFGVCRSGGSSGGGGGGRAARYLPAVPNKTKEEEEEEKRLAGTANGLPMVRYKDKCIVDFYNKESQISFLSANIRQKRGSDTGFLLYLLRETDKDIAENFCHFMDPIFHEELEEVVTNQRWPLSTLKERLRIGESDGEKTLSLADQDLLGLPIALSLVEVSGDHLVELDLSYNQNVDDLGPLVDLKNLISLKCCRCGIVDMQPIVELPQLNFLDVSSNKIVSIPEDIHRLKQLKAFWVDHNALPSLTVGLLQLPRLNEIRVEEALVSAMPRQQRAAWKRSKLQPQMWKKIKSGESLGDGSGGGRAGGGSGGGGGGATKNDVVDGGGIGDDNAEDGEAASDERV